VAVPSYFRLPADARRSADEAKLKKRSTKRCASAFSSFAFGPASCCCTNWLRGWPLVSAIVMLRESSTMTATKFCCGTDAFRTSVGRNRQTTMRMARSRGGCSAAVFRYVRRAATPIAAAIAAARATPRDAPHDRSPC
jgi:hypothetical protein